MEEEQKPKQRLKVKKAFSWAHRHVEIKEYAKGDEIETDDQDLVRVATEEGWAEVPKASVQTPAPSPAPTPAPSPAPEA